MMISLLNLKLKFFRMTIKKKPRDNSQIFSAKNRICRLVSSNALLCRKGITNWEDKKFSNKVKNSCRIYPQDNNTEGFFLAKFRRVK